MQIPTITQAAIESASRPLLESDRHNGARRADDLAALIELLRELDITIEFPNWNSRVFVCGPQMNRLPRTWRGQPMATVLRNAVECGVPSVTFTQREAAQDVRHAREV